MPNKQPNVKNTPQIGKLPRHLEPYKDEKRVFWSFAIFDPELIFPVAKKPVLNFHEIGTAIKSIESRRWSDIEMNQHRDHPIERTQLAKFAQKRLDELQLDDFEELWSIHINGEMRLWGIRDGSLLQILWLDPKHEVCPSRKKNT